MSREELSAIHNILDAARKYYDIPGLTTEAKQAGLEAFLASMPPSVSQAPSIKIVKDTVIAEIGRLARETPSSPKIERQGTPQTRRKKAGKASDSSAHKG